MPGFFSFKIKILIYSRLMSFSLVIPFYNEEQNIEDLLVEIISVFKNFNSYEMILINDASLDNTQISLEKFKKKYPNIITIINNKTNQGQSLSLIKGIKISKYDVIVTLDGDGQNDPNDIPKLLDEYKKFNLALVGGLRLKRQDSIIKIYSSKIANSIRNYFLKDDCLDTGCALKIFNKKIFLQFSHFKGIHRFLPALYKGYGYKTKFLEVSHRPRKHGKSKYGTFLRMINGVIDLVKVYFMIKNQNKSDV